MELILPLALAATYEGLLRLTVLLSCSWFSNGNCMLTDISCSVRLALVLF